jgi:hypothetical protein
MEAMRQSWTDDRLDDLRDDLNAFRVETKTEFTSVRAEMKSEFTSVRAEMKAEFAAVRDEMHGEFRALRMEMAVGFGHLHQRFDRLFQTIIGLVGVMIASLIGFIATQL